MGKIKWSSEAFDWLKNVHAYIFKENPQVAYKIIKGILQKIETLRDFPEIGYHLKTSSNKKVHVLLYGHYRIVYQVNEERDINIIGIFHGALDLEKHFKIK